MEVGGWRGGEVGRWEGVEGWEDVIKSKHTQLVIAKVWQLTDNCKYDMKSEWIAQCCVDNHKQLLQATQHTTNPNRTTTI
jgi:hypothetical protein